MDAPPKARRGFAAMAPDTRREISRKGGIMVHKRGTAYEWTIKEAREVGRLGGLSTQKKRREAEAEREQMETEAREAQLQAEAADDAESQFFDRR